MTPEQAADKGYIECILDGARGIYIPQAFIEGFDGWQGISAEDRDILKEGPDHEHYWEAWDTVLNDARWIDEHGHEWFLSQEGDLFAIRADVDIEWD